MHERHDRLHGALCGGRGAGKTVGVRRCFDVGRLDPGGHQGRDEIVHPEPGLGAAMPTGSPMPTRDVRGFGVFPGINSLRIVAWAEYGAGGRSGKLRETLILVEQTYQ